eukprot:Nk52_evm79s554 gene=Nk52_evmTU79s554
MAGVKRKLREEKETVATRRSKRISTKSVDSDSPVKLKVEDSLKKSKKTAKDKPSPTKKESKSKSKVKSEDMSKPTEIARKSNDGVVRCFWGGESDSNELMLKYHDEQWGVPVYDDRELFEMLSLEGAQAGLSWRTILNKREGYRKAFLNFEAEKIIKKFGDVKSGKGNEREINALLNDTEIVRNRLKINSVINNAACFLDVKKEMGSFQKYLWGIVGNVPINNSFTSMKQVPAQTELSLKMSNSLKGRGFRFVGPTICYAFMQAVGMVNDHSPKCFRYNQILKQQTTK